MGTIVSLLTAAGIAALFLNGSLTLGIGVATALAAIAIGTAALKSEVGSEADDLFAPPEGGSGYGKRMLIGPEGAIALNNKDTVIAGTNLFPKGDDIVSAGAGDIQLSR